MTQINPNSKGFAMSMISEQKIVSRAKKWTKRYLGFCMSVTDRRISGLTPNENGIRWFPQTEIMRYSDGSFMAAYIGTIEIKHWDKRLAKHTGNGTNCALYGITPDGKVDLWAN